MSDSLYERDALAWSEHQAQLLKRLSAGERVNDAVDWANVIEEVQDVGLSELHACQSLLQQAIMHLLKLHAAPNSRDAKHGRQEAGVLDDANRRFTSSMRQRIDLEGLYASAARRVSGAKGFRPQGPPEACPFTLDALLAGDLADLLARL